MLHSMRLFLLLQSLGGRAVSGPLLQGGRALLQLGRLGGKEADLDAAALLCIHVKRQMQPTSSNSFLCFVPSVSVFAFSSALFLSDYSPLSSR